MPQGVFRSNMKLMHDVLLDIRIRHNALRNRLIRSLKQTLLVADLRDTNGFRILSGKQDD